MKWLLYILLFASCTSPNWVIKKEAGCSVIIYAESLHSSAMVESEFKKLSDALEALRANMDECIIIDTRLRGISYLKGDLNGKKW